ncbi:MAG: PadR family transcriptional regulator [Candidatus Thorarchaeota archaeon]
MRASELKTSVLRMGGKEEFYGYEIHKKLEENKIVIGIGRLYAILSEMKKDGLLKDRWEKSKSGPKRRVYQTTKKGRTARNAILIEAIKTVHEFYTEYLYSLPPKHSVFNIVSRMVVESLPKNPNMAYVSDRFTGPIKKLMERLQERVSKGNLYAIHRKGKSPDLGMIDVSKVAGSIDDIPMKDDFLDLLLVSGGESHEKLESNLVEWRRVTKKTGTVVMVTPTALLAKYKDPLDIGDFIEQREHPRLDQEDNLDTEIVTKKMLKYFEVVEVDKVIHITVIRGINPRK